jgi:hypothetical protein
VNVDWRLPGMDEEPEPDEARVAVLAYYRQRIAAFEGTGYTWTKALLKRARDAERDDPEWRPDLGRAR